MCLEQASLCVLGQNRVEVNVWAFCLLWAKEKVSISFKKGLEILNICYNTCVFLVCQQAFLGARGLEDGLVSYHCLLLLVIVWDRTTC